MAYDEIPSGIRSTAGLLGYQTFRPSTDRLEDYQEQFAKALANSDADPIRAAGIMAEIRREASDYVAADVQDYRRDINFQTIDNLRRSGRMNDITIEQYVLMEKVSGHWHTGRHALNTITEDKGYDFHPNGGLRLKIAQCHGCAGAVVPDIFELPVSFTVLQVVVRDLRPLVIGRRPADRLVKVHPLAQVVVPVQIDAGNELHVFDFQGLGCHEASFGVSTTRLVKIRPDWPSGRQFITFYYAG